MILKTNDPITDFSGNQLGDHTLGSICIDVLLSSQEKVDGNEKLSRWQLAKRLHEGDEVTITVSEAQIIRSLVAEHYTPVIVGPIFNALGGE